MAEKATPETKAESPSPDDSGVQPGADDATSSVPAAPVVPTPPAKSGGSRPTTKRASKERIEEYEATKPDGTKVTVRRNIDTGASEIVDG